MGVSTGDKTSEFAKFDPEKGNESWFSILEESMLDRATDFYLGNYKVPTLASALPVYIERMMERDGQGWAVRCNGGMNPHYLNVNLPGGRIWVYKHGSTFTTWKEALWWFNLWVAYTKERGETNHWKECDDVEREV